MSPFDSLVEKYALLLHAAVDTMTPEEYQEAHAVCIRAKEEQKKLQTESDFLAALESSGVDNWDGYSEAYRSLKS